LSGSVFGGKVINTDSYNVVETVCIASTVSGAGGKYPRALCGRSTLYLMKCGICDCKVIGEVKKNKYKYYHCTFSKGRHKDVAYIREEKLAEMFVEPIQRISLNNDIVEWLKEGLRERSKNTLRLQENCYNSLQNQHDKTNKRLSRFIRCQV
jgi:hypothetical protein